MSTKKCIIMGEESMDDLIKDEIQIRHKIEELIIAGILNFTVVLPGEFSMLAISSITKLKILYQNIKVDFVIYKEESEIKNIITDYRVILTNYGDKTNCFQDTLNYAITKGILLEFINDAKPLFFNRCSTNAEYKVIKPQI